MGSAAVLVELIAKIGGFKGILPENQGIFAIGVVAATAAQGLKSQAFVQGQGATVGGAHLQGGAGEGAIADILQQIEQQPFPQAPPLVAGINGQHGDVGLI
jgi:hypothetical protein